MSWGLLGLFDGPMQYFIYLPVLLDFQISLPLGLIIFIFVSPRTLIKFQNSYKKYTSGLKISYHGLTVIGCSESLGIIKNTVKLNFPSHNLKLHTL